VSARERAALDFAERLAAAPTAIDDGFMAELRRLFTDAEVVELGLVAAAFTMLGRLHRAFGVAPMQPTTHTLLAEPPADA
jgi:alkylhydroperoxidase family enzyme